MMQIYCGLEHFPEGIINNEFKDFASRVAICSQLMKKKIICFVGSLHWWAILLTNKMPVHYLSVLCKLQIKVHVQWNPVS